MPDDNIPTSPIVVSAIDTPPKKKRIHLSVSERQFKRLAAVLIGVGVVVALYINVLAPKTPPCGPQLLKDARHAVTLEQSAKLHSIAETVKTKSGYKNDVNCQYVLMEDSVLNGQSKQAYATYDNLVQLYNPKIGFSKDLGADREAMARFKSAVAYFKLQENEAKQNYVGVKEP